jgi:hypothetical protein
MVATQEKLMTSLGTNTIPGRLLPCLTTIYYMYGKWHILFMQSVPTKMKFTKSYFNSCVASMEHNGSKEILNEEVTVTTVHPLVREQLKAYLSRKDARAGARCRIFG